MQSNRPEAFTAFLDRLQETAEDFGCFEVIVKIDDTDLAMQQHLQMEISRRPFRLKCIVTPLPDGFYGLWRSMNDMLEVSDPDAYFLMNGYDELQFKIKGWDRILKGYVGLFPDHIF